VTFQFILLTDTPYSPLPRDLRAQLTKAEDGWTESAYANGETYPIPRTVVAVEVQVIYRRPSLFQWLIDFTLLPDDRTVKMAPFITGV